MHTMQVVFLAFVFALQPALTRAQGLQMRAASKERTRVEVTVNGDQLAERLQSPAASQSPHQPSGFRENNLIRRRETQIQNMMQPDVPQGEQPDAPEDLQVQENDAPDAPEELDAHGNVIPPRCMVWFDGCNTCTSTGEFHSCTRKLCDELGAAKCLAPDVSEQTDAPEDEQPNAPDALVNDALGMQAEDEQPDAAPVNDALGMQAEDMQVQEKTFCVALSGNGGAWAATMAFISESLLAYLDNLPETVQTIDLGCAIGASSGSGAVALYQSLVYNDEFASQNGKANRDQAKNIARALNILSQAADLPAKQSVGTIVKSLIAGKKPSGAWNKCGWDEYVPSDSPHIMKSFQWSIKVAKKMGPKAWTERIKVKNWRGKVTERIDMSEVKDLIGQNTKQKLWEMGKDAFNRFKNNLKDLGFNRKDTEDIDKSRRSWNKKRKDLSTSNLQDTAEKAQYVRVWDFPKIDKSNVNLLERSGKGSKRKEKVQDQLDFILEDVRTTWIDHLKTLYNAPENSDYNKAYHQDARRGFITMVATHPRTRREQNKHSVDGVTYDNMRILALMSSDTALAILGSATYQAALRVCETNPQATECDYMDRYILGVVETVEPMVKLSTMEPGIIEPYISSLKSSAVVQYFDPKEERPGEPRLRDATDTDELHVFLGGFVLNGMGYRLQKHYINGIDRGEHVQYALYGTSKYEGGMAKDILKNQLPKWQAKCQCGENSESDSCASFGKDHKLKPYRPKDDDLQKLGDDMWDDFLSWAEDFDTNGVLNTVMDWNCKAAYPSNMLGWSWKLRLHATYMTRMAAKKLGWERFTEDEGYEFYDHPEYVECDEKFLADPDGYVVADH